MGSLTKEGAWVSQLQAQPLCNAGVLGALTHAVILRHVCSSGSGSRGSSIEDAQCKQLQGQAARQHKAASRGICRGRMSCRSSSGAPDASAARLNPSHLPHTLNPPIVTPPLQKVWKKRHIPVSGLRSSPCSGASSTCRGAEGGAGEAAGLRSIAKAACALQDTRPWLAALALTPAQRQPQ